MLPAPQGCASQPARLKRCGAARSAGIILYMALARLLLRRSRVVRRRRLSDSRSTALRAVPLSTWDPPVARFCPALRPAAQALRDLVTGPPTCCPGVDRRGRDLSYVEVMDMLRNLRQSIYRGLLHLVAELIAFDNVHNCCSCCEQCQKCTHCSGCLGLEFLEHVQRFLYRADFVDALHGR